MNNRRITLVRPSQMFDSFVDEFFSNNDLSTLMTGSVDIDMYETESNIVIKVKAPGYKEDDVKINVENNILSVEGIIKQKTEQNENRKYHIKELKQ